MPASPLLSMLVIDCAQANADPWVTNAFVCRLAVCLTIRSFSKITPCCPTSKTSTDAGKHRLDHFGHRCVPDSWITEKGNPIVSQGGDAAYAHKDFCHFLMTLIDSGLSVEEINKVRCGHLPAGGLTNARSLVKPCRAGHAALERRDDPRRQQSFSMQCVNESIAVGPPDRSIGPVTMQADNMYYLVSGSICTRITIGGWLPMGYRMCVTGDMIFLVVGKGG